MRKISLKDFRCDARALERFADTFDQMGWRADANEVAFTARGLEYIFQQTYDVLYPELKGKSLVPVNTSVPSGAQFYTWFQFDKVGDARVITNYADDFVNGAEEFMKEFTSNIIAIGNSFSYSVQDLRAAAAIQLGVGRPLDRMRAEIARWTHDSKVDDLIAYGYSPRGINGFVNHPDITPVSPISGGWSTTLATVNSTNNAAIIADLNKLVNSVEQTSLGVEMPDTLALPLSVKPRLYQPMHPDVFNPSPLIVHWFKQQDVIKNIEFWNKLDAANSAGALASGNATALCYKREPRVLECVIPQEFEMFEPERRGMTLRVPTHSRFGGVTLHYPVAVASMNVGT